MVRNENVFLACVLIRQKNILDSVNSQKTYYAGSAPIVWRVSIDVLVWGRYDRHHQHMFPSTDDFT